jgi:hypothetical protein
LQGVEDGGNAGGVCGGFFGGHNFVLREKLYVGPSALCGLNWCMYLGLRPRLV